MIGGQAVVTAPLGSKPSREGATEALPDEHRHKVPELSRDRESHTPAGNSTTERRRPRGKADAELSGSTGRVRKATVSRLEIDHRDQDAAAAGNRDGSSVRRSVRRQGRHGDGAETAHSRSAARRTVDSTAVHRDGSGVVDHKAAQRLTSLGHEACRNGMQSTRRGQAQSVSNAHDEDCTLARKGQDVCPDGRRRRGRRGPEESRVIQGIGGKCLGRRQAVKGSTRSPFSRGKEAAHGAWVEERRADIAASLLKKTQEAERASTKAHRGQGGVAPQGGDAARRGEQSGSSRGRPREELGGGIIDLEEVEVSVKGHRVSAWKHERGNRSRRRGGKRGASKSCATV
mmetsp:Transcript_14506/g.49095  ORF Transcript_14506/g.49095 Transcript_14506/m.49095 type:complete len:344 (-) Transcript_14506:272-1303(-)